jgi:hypothetical protein
MHAANLVFRSLGWFENRWFLHHIYLLFSEGNLTHNNFRRLILFEFARILAAYNFLSYFWEIAYLVLLSLRGLMDCCLININMSYFSGWFLSYKMKKIERNPIKWLAVRTATYLWSSVENNSFIVSPASFLRNGKIKCE